MIQSKNKKYAILYKINYRDRMLFTAIQSFLYMKSLGKDIWSICLICHAPNIYKWYTVVNILLNVKLESKYFEYMVKFE